MYVCVLQIVGRVKATSSIPTTAAAALAAANTAALEAAAAANISRGADSTPETAATALASPRHGLHSPRPRVPEQQVELAVVGPGDIIGECTRDCVGPSVCVWPTVGCV